MSRSVLILLIGVLACEMSYSQTKDSVSSKSSKPFIGTVEIYVGGSLLYATSPYVFPFAKRDVKFGYSAGLGFIHDFNNRLQLSAVLSYEGKGYASKEALPSAVTIYVNASNDYFTFTLFPSLQIKESLPLSVGLGLYVGYLNSSKTKVTYDSISGKSAYYEINTRSEYANYDWGIVVAIKYCFLLKKKNFFLRVVNNNGFTSIDRSVYQPSEAAIDKNNSLVLSIGMKIR